MLNKHAGTQLLKGAGDPPPDIRFGNDQYIQIVGVTPEPNRDLPIFSNPNASTQIKAYYEHKCVFTYIPHHVNPDPILNFSATNIFSFSRPLVKYARDGSEEAWTEKTYLTTEAAFPTVLRRSEVVQTQAIYISPIESALADLEQKTRELAGLYMRYTAVAQTGNPVSTNPFSMTLNSFVDAPSDSGIALWRRTFLSPEYLSLWPDRANHVETLRKVIDEHVCAIGLLVTHVLTVNL
jgi:dedicator of cytokinesis protein 3